MTKKKGMIGRISENYQTAEMVISAQPLQATEALLDFALLGACIAAAKMAIATNTTIIGNIEKWTKSKPLDYAMAVGMLSLLGPIGVFIGIPAAASIRKEATPLGLSTIASSLLDPELRNWAISITVGVLAYGTLKYAGASIVDGISGAIKGGFSTIGLLGGL